MEIGKIYKFGIYDYDMNGQGVAKEAGVVVFVEGALKDEIVLAEVTSVHKKYVFAKTVKVLSPSNERLVSPCAYYDGCGGCDLLHMEYKTECLIKQKKVTDMFSKTIKQPKIKINKLIKNDYILGYRNKVMMPFGYDEDDNVVYGFYAKLSHELISIDKCEISNFYVNEVVEFIRKYISVMNVKVYNEEEHKGIFRGVMVRNNCHNEMMLVLIATQSYDFSKMIEYIKEDYPLVKSIYLNINSKKTNVLLSNDFIHLYGEENLIEDILGLKFNVSASSFMQVNHNSCEKLYLEAFRLAKLQPSMNVIDAYCGMGSITLNIAKKVNHVYGIEIVPSAIENANVNKTLNNITNATFICGKCEDEIKKLVGKEKIDCIFFDPPRKGCDESFLNSVVEMKIPKIIYISCNIATLCRDVKYLLDNGYEAKEVTPVDLFSKTSHIETICSLELKK